MRRTSRRGFTLVEAIISLTLLSLVFIELGQLQRTAAQVLDQIQTGTGSAAIRTRGYRQFSQDCAHFANPGILPPGTPVMDLSSTTGASSTAKISFFTIEQSTAGAQALRKVTYELVGTELVRTSTEPTTLFPARGDAEPDRRTVLADGVKGLAIQFWDGNTVVGDWVASGRKGLPQGLLLVMTVEGGRSLIFPRGFNGGVI